MDIYDMSMEQMRIMFPAEMSAFDQWLAGLIQCTKSVQAAIGNECARRAMEQDMTVQGIRELNMYIGIITDIQERLQAMQSGALKNQQTPYPNQTPEQVGHALYVKPVSVIPNPNGQTQVQIGKMMGDAIVREHTDSFRAQEEQDDLAYAAEAPIPVLTENTPKSIASYSSFGNQKTYTTAADMAYDVICDIYRHTPDGVAWYAKNRPNPLLSYDTDGMQDAIAVGGGLFLDIPETADPKDIIEFVYDIMRTLSISQESFLIYYGKE